MLKRKSLNQSINHREQEDLPGFTPPARAKLGPLTRSPGLCWPSLLSLPWGLWAPTVPHAPCCVWPTSRRPLSSWASSLPLLGTLTPLSGSGDRIHVQLGGLTWRGHPPPERGADAALPLPAACLSFPGNSQPCSLVTWVPGGGLAGH